MEKYKLKKDTFFNKAGTICKLTPKGNIVLDNCEGTCILHDYQLREHPKLLDEWFEKIEEKKYGGRVPKNGDEYWYIAGDGTILSSIWSGYGKVCSADASRFESGSAFWTREEAEKELKRRKAYVILKDDTKGFEPNWTDGEQAKYFVAYSYYENTLNVDIAWRYKAIGQKLYFATEEDVRISINDHKQQWLDYLDAEDEK